MTTYLLKTLLCSGILLLAYRLFLEKEKMHRFNRWYLLISMAFSFLVPFIVLQNQKEIVPFAEPVYFVNTEGTAVAVSEVSHERVTQGNADNRRADPFLIIYSFITLFLLLRLFKNLFAFAKKIQSGEKVKYGKAALVLADVCPVPYSFFNYIFLSKEAYASGAVEEEILHHELTHVRQNHSYDILFTEMVLCFAWFNPFLYGFRKAIQLNHEFLADDSVIQKFRNTTSYQYLLLQKAKQVSCSLLASSFNYLTTKKRLIMMTKTFSPFMTGLKQIMILPLSVALVFLFSTKLVAQKAEEAFEKQQEQKMVKTDKDTVIIPAPLIYQSLGYSKTDAPENILKEFHDIIAKYKAGDLLKWQDLQKLSKEDRVKLEILFRQMSLAQQSKQDVAFLKRLPPSPKVVPTKTQFEDFKNPKVYGIWINEKRVPNSELNKYQNTDFSQVFVSKLYGAAKKGRSYTHQADLMTNDYYQDYYRKAKARENESIMTVVQRGSKSWGFIDVN